ncbi:MAG: methyltransferase family protein [Promethearchaeota archaeon]
MLYYNICYFIFIPEIFNNPLFLIALLIYYSVTCIDTIIRPSSKKREIANKYDLILIILFVFSPFLLILAFYENKFLISKYFLIWDNLIISYIRIIFFILGGIISILGRIHLGKYTSGQLVIQDDHKLIMTGIYSHIRHPLYLDSLIAGFSFLMIFRSFIIAIVELIFLFIIFK